MKCRAETQIKYHRISESISKIHECYINMEMGLEEAIKQVADVNKKKNDQCHTKMQLSIAHHCSRCNSV